MEEQKKTQGEAGGDSLFDGGFDTAVPERPWARWMFSHSRSTIPAL